MLTDSITLLKGIGEKRAQTFFESGLFTKEDVLRFFPIKYLDYSKTVPICELKQDMHCAIKVTICSDAKLARFHGISVVTCRAQDETGTVLVKCFNQPYRKGNFHSGDELILCGRIDLHHGTCILNPEIHRELPGIQPVYRLKKGLSQSVLRTCARQVLSEGVLEMEDMFPAPIRSRFQLLSLQETYYKAHFPESMSDVYQAKRRIAFQNAFYYLLAAQATRLEKHSMKGISFSTEGVLERFLELFPFRPTDSQMKVISEISRDMQAKVPMNRLVQGDVGSGKTLVAMFAMFLAVSNGYQAVLMAPTEILAQQHYSTICRAFGEERSAILRGGIPARERKRQLERICQGEASVIVGTHALLEDSVTFARLGIVITDEQHRFGVSQRAILETKGETPDVLVMSATPIPRTLALLAYGDLDHSIIDQLPAGRVPIRTSYVPEKKRADMYRYIVEQAESDVRTYIVCPQIENDEGIPDGMSAVSLYKQLQKAYPDSSIGLLHGKMKPLEKAGILDAFRTGSIKVLVSTTVVEVGVDVPEACIMVIENAHRFGLSQLHQLRGRVGRNTKQSYCFLLGDVENEQARARIQALCNATDGFLLAEEDLRLRGPGDIFGIRQHGQESELLDCDMDILQDAYDAAKTIAEQADVFEKLIVAAKEYTTRMERITLN